MNLIIYTQRFIIWIIFFLALLPKMVFASVENRFDLLEQEKNIAEKELTSFLDKFFNEQMQKQHIPGASIVIVKNGQVIISKGYGYTNVDKATPVDPNKTLFRVASITKLFTATAIMKLVEEGKLDLKEDVNHYLKNLQIKSSFEKKITVADLLLHTAGFEDSFFSSYTYNKSEVLSLENYLQKYQPLRAYPPSEVFSYSNYGYTLAGYLIETVSGLSFENYIEEKVFRPLGMKNSGFVYPEAGKDLASGYRYQGQHYEPINFYYLKQAPAMGLITTATDLVPFMVAHLQGGKYQNETLLLEPTVKLMQARQFAGHPKLPGNTFGFRDLVKNGQRAIRHDGRIEGFQSLMYLIPEQNLGFFLAYNCSGNSLYLDFTQAFLDHFFSIKIEPPTPISNYKERAKRFIGSYRNLRYSHSKIEKLDTLVAQYHISANEDGTITLHSPEKSLGNWIEIEPLLFRKVDEDIYLAFRENEQGQITSLLYNYWFLEKLPFYEVDSFQLGLIYFFIITFSVTCLYLLVVLRKQKKEQINYRKQFFGQMVTFWVSLLNLVFLTTWLLCYQSWYEEIVFKVPTFLVLLLWLPLVSLILTFTLPIWTKITWNCKTNNLFKKLYLCFFTLVAWGFIGFLYYWKLLGFNFY